MTVRATQKASDLPILRKVWEAWKPSAEPPRTTVSTRIPNTSSMTSAAMVVTPSGVARRPISRSTRAVMPVEVALTMAPTKRA